MSFLQFLWLVHHILSSKVCGTWILYEYILYAVQTCIIYIYIHMKMSGSILYIYNIKILGMINKGKGTYLHKSWFLSLFQPHYDQNIVRIFC